MFDRIHIRCTIKYIYIYQFWIHICWFGYGLDVFAVFKCCMKVMSMSEVYRYIYILYLHMYLLLAHDYCDLSVDSFWCWMLFFGSSVSVQASIPRDQVYQMCRLWLTSAMLPSPSRNSHPTSPEEMQKASQGKHHIWEASCARVGGPLLFQEMNITPENWGLEDDLLFRQHLLTCYRCYVCFSLSENHQFQNTTQNCRAPYREEPSSFQQLE